ncbi:hypothetical protein ABW19_dt0205200 [Dactylella cylindrospora]|nr:hypothetical protein ABW19_dt0205200 [Dactylella cylindrospora]
MRHRGLTQWLVVASLSIVIQIYNLCAEAHPVKKWPVVPDRQLHWSGLRTTEPGYALPKKPSATNIEYEEFLKSKASGQNPTATFRPDSWSKFNYHLENRSIDPGDHPPQKNIPPVTEQVLVRQDNNTKCNASLTPLNYCPKTEQDIQKSYRELRKGLAIGSTVAILGGLLIAFIYVFQRKFFGYFEHKERWYVERARAKSIKLVNISLVKSGIDEPFPENLDQWILDRPPSQFWAGIFESEGFILFLFWLEARIKAKGKFTGIMTRPKLGDEDSGIPLNSARARRRYGKKRTVAPKLASETRRVSGSELPAPIGTLHRRGRSSRVASISSMRIRLNKDNEGSPSGDSSRVPSRKSYQMPSGFGGSSLEGDVEERDAEIEGQRKDPLNSVEEQC